MPDWCPKCHAMLSPGLDTCPICGACLPTSSSASTQQMNEKANISTQDFFWLSAYIIGIGLIPILVFLGIGLLCLLFWQGFQ